MSEANGPASASAAVPRPAGPGSADEERLTYTVDEAAQLLGISRRHTWRQIAKGRIPVVRFGRRTLISRAALQAVLNAPGGERPGGSAACRPEGALLRVMT